MNPLIDSKPEADEGRPNLFHFEGYDRGKWHMYVLANSLEEAIHKFRIKTKRKPSSVVQMSVDGQVIL